MERRLWVLVLLIVALWGDLARAASDVTARQAFRRAQAAAWAGGLVSVAGLPLAVAGPILAKAGPDYSPAGQYGLGVAMYAGGLAMVGGGGAVLAGGSLAARRVLVRHGATVTAVPGILAWGACGVAVTSALVLPLFSDIPGAEWIALTSYVATLGLGATQVALNHRAMRRLPEGALDGPRGVAFAVTPTVGPDGAGVVLAASF